MDMKMVMRENGIVVELKFTSLAVSFIHYLRNTTDTRDDSIEIRLEVDLAWVTKVTYVQHFHGRKCVDLLRASSAVSGHSKQK